MTEKLDKFLKRWVVKGTYFDYPTLFYIVFLSFFGFIMIYSSSSFISYRIYGNRVHFLNFQLLFAGLGFIGMLFVSKIRYQRMKRFTIILLAAELLLLIIVLIKGVSVNGSSRWIQMGALRFQPSEIAKMAIILYMAYICSEKPELMRTLKGTVNMFVPVGVLIIFIAIENMSTALICAAIAVGIWFIATPKLVYLLAMVPVGVLGLLLMIFGRGYRGDRITTWLNPEGTEKGYQTMQGLYAIASGGLFGRGLGQSIQKMGNIPEAQNDMIFSVICEELGIVGAAGLILVFLLLIWRCKFIAEGAPDRYGSFIVSGIIIHIAVQVVINMCVVTNLMPNTGVPLPFISYGGTSIVFLMVEMGLLLGVSRQIEPEGYRQEMLEDEN
ncbi:MAG: cell division protein FtsW [Eubacterium sp.]|nr:cell division protein FtsW [Eubacterium sp.]